MQQNKITTYLLLLLLTWCLGPCGDIVVPTVYSAAPPGVTTAPYRATYTAKLMSAAGTPVTTAQDVRFSLWKDADWTAANVNALGDIEVSSADFAGWQETHTVTPNAEGIFTVQMGSITPFPNFTASTHIFLEVDVKPHSSANTAFEVLDPDGNTGNTNDRKPFNAAPYAINADTVDNRDADNSANNIPVLDANGKLIYGIMPDGINADSFTIDANNDSPANITLQFGQALAQYLRWNVPASRFELSGGLNINGNLSFSGTAQISGATIDGTINNFQNIPITAIAPHAKQVRLTPKFANETLSPDGSNNVGTLKTGYDKSEKKHFYQWSTNLAAEQDMDLVVRYQLPSDFVSFAATPLVLSYQTADNDTAHNYLTLTMENNAGVAIPVNAAANLTTSASWNETNVTFAGVPVFAANDYLELTFHVTGVAGKYTRIGEVVINYNGR